uniref:Protein ENHANCED DISEASE RESISTANCE 2-like n=1 Tax=Kalanchoe fedtschenkoi TaxID=63787 RepID=A0A7N0U781_KALFE
MSSPSGGNRMEGWLYMIRSNRLGLQYSRKRYFVLEDHCLKSFKSAPDSNCQDPVRSAVIDSCIRVTDHGRESIQRKVFFIFTLCNTSNHNDQLKLGASSPDEAARWIQTLQDVSLKAGPNVGDNVLDCSKSPCRSFRVHQSNSIDWTLYSSTFADPVSSDVIAPSPWTIFGCQNGLRLFKEPKDKDSSWRDDHPALMAVGVVEGTSEAIFQTIMSLGPSRSEWDFCFYKGYVVEHLDGHTDIIHKQFHSDWMPWGMKCRDLLLRRYWRRDDDGTYVILYHSVFHKRCPTQKGYVRACLKSGGYVISPTNQGKHSVVKHMLAIDWKFWRSYLKPSLARSITIKLLERVAALREMFRAKSGYMPSSDFSSGELSREIRQCNSVGDGKVDIWTTESNGNSLGTKESDMGRTLSRRASLGDLNDDADEFFDVPEPSDYDHSEDDWTSNFGPECQDLRHSRLSTAAGFVKKLHDLAVQKRGYTDLREMTSVDRDSCCYGCTLLKDSTSTLLSSYSTTEPSTFLIRGKSFFEDNQKVKAKGTLMQLVGADWIKSDMREDDLGGRPNSIVQKYAAKDGPEFFFIVNIQVPGSSPHSLAFYYMMSTPLGEVPLLESFVNGDDAFRNSRFKLIPCIAKGPWIVKQTVRNKACLIGQQLQINYFRGKNYLEVGIDVGSSTLARGAVSVVFGYLSHLVIEMAFLIQANTYEELPEYLLGTCRLNHLDPSKSVPVAI